MWPLYEINGLKNDSFTENMTSYKCPTDIIYFLVKRNIGGEENVSWLSQNNLTSNLDKLYMRTSSKVLETLRVSKLKIKREYRWTKWNMVKLVGIKSRCSPVQIPLQSYNRLGFNYHVSHICKKSSKNYIHFLAFLST